jgi:acyl transferase domain-containing protein/phosphopantetheinyl transferase
MRDETRDRDVAIVGMAAQFPGAPDLRSFAENVFEGRDAISIAPRDRQDPVFFDPRSRAPDRFAVNRGGFLGSTASFDAIAFGVMPIAAAGAEPDQLLGLAVAHAALADAGYEERSFARDRASVIVGRGGYLTPGVARLAERIRGTEQVLRALRAIVPSIDEARLGQVKDAIAEALGPYGADTAIGLVPNLAASRIANRLDLHGGAYTVDAACASALVAVDHAVRDLRDRTCDLAIAGAMHLCHDPVFYSVFSELGALSPSQAIRPFDRRADGLLIGEGIGMIVLKRLADAERDGDRIYAVIAGTGISSDGRGAGLMAPSLEGQVLALRRAWEASKRDPASVGLIEAHGTATPTGDATELATLARFFGPAGADTARAGLGSVKSMIGHAMPAAGIAGLIKAALAVHERTLPPTLHCEEPRPELEATRFRIVAEAEPWIGGEPRRAGVNAFGFGGINAHVVLEEHGAPARTRPRARAEELLLLAAESTTELLHALERGDRSSRLEGEARLALFNPTADRVARAKAIVARGEPWRGRDDLWFTPRGLLHDGGKIAFLFPGIDASFKPRADDVARHFGLPLEMPADTSSLAGRGVAIIALGRLLDRALAEIGVVPDAIAGHSIGEWTGMIASEMVPSEDVDALIERLAPEPVEVPGVVFLAAGCGVDEAREAMAGLDEIAVSHDNCPHQVLLCGRADSAETARDRLTRAGILCQLLPFQSGYHSPLFADFVRPHERVLATLPLEPMRVPLWSATTTAPYPADPEAVRSLSIEHLVKPVRFRELVLAMHERGVRMFVQVGTGSLVGFVDDTLRKLPHAAISANVPTREGLAQLRRVAAAILVEGGVARLDRLESSARPAPKGAVELRLGVPIVDLDPSLAIVSTTEAPVLDPSGSTIAAELEAGLRGIAAARDDVMRAFKARNVSVSGERERVFIRRMSVERYPFLVDHSFYRQAPGASLADRYPVVPMTMIMATMMEVARELVPELIPIALLRVRAYRWLAVEPPVDLELRASFDGTRHVDITIEGYAAGTVEMAVAYPPAPASSLDALEGETRAPIAAAELYDKRWMFHGTAYQGVVELGPLASNGIRGTLVSLDAKGGLLDNAGQLLGFWVMHQVSVDRLAMPVIIDRASFFAPEPEPGTRLECTAVVRELDASSVLADVELVHDGALWAKIDGWEDRRFDTDPRVWDVLMYPEWNGLGEHHEAFTSVTPPWRSTASRDLLARRYLDERERAVHAELGPRAKSDWLLGRIALKDAIRRHLWDHGHGPIFPAEIEIENDASGKPIARGPFTDLEVTVAHKNGIAVARVSDRGPAGIDVEQVRPRGTEFELVAFTAHELRLLPSEDRDVWIARFWVAKEATAKWLGTGLLGAPRDFVVTEIDGPSLFVHARGRSVRVETVALEDHIVGWTCP